MILTNKVRTCAINVMSFDDSNFQQLIYGIICNLISAFYFRSLSICLGDLEPAIIGFVFFSVWVFLSPVSFMLYIINILCTNVFCLLRKSNRGKVSLGICNASAKGSRGRRKTNLISEYVRGGEKKSILHRGITINTGLSRTANHFSASYRSRFHIRAWQGWETMARSIKMNLGLGASKFMRQQEYHKI